MKVNFAYTPEVAMDLSKGWLLLNAVNAQKYHSYSGHDYYSTKPTVIKLEWFLLTEEKENYRLRLKYHSDHPGDELSLTINGTEHLFSSPDGSDKDWVKEIALVPGSLNQVSLSFNKPANPHKGLNLEGLELVIR